jgi:pyruvate,orthophosphate dikinase
MPEMMDTALNLGLTDKPVIGLANEVSSERVSYSDALEREKYVS